MSITLLAWIFGGALIGFIVLARLLRHRDPGGYRRRFVNGAPLRDRTAPPADDSAFPFASTLFVGDGGSASHASHHHSADCSHVSDWGGGCSDGGGGGSN